MTTGTPRPPLALTSSAVSSTVRSSAPCAREERPLTKTVAPHSPSTSAMPFPTPRLAPVTTATRSARFGGAQVTPGFSRRRRSHVAADAAPRWPPPDECGVGTRPHAQAELEAAQLRAGMRVEREVDGAPDELGHRETASRGLVDEE